MADILSLPKDMKLLAAIGPLAIAHGKLDYVLRLTIKSIGKLDLKSVRDDTRRCSSQALRQRVRRIAEEKVRSTDVLVQIDALLARAEGLTKVRNRLLHDITYHTKSGEFMLKEDNEPHRPYPSPVELNCITRDMLQLAAEVNHARQPEGFIGEAL